ncbi:hypothetical protein [Limoniibacter endophyticus]|nr:hypothetical protein [Limoniibacter endophyticus]
MLRLIALSAIAYTIWRVVEENRPDPTRLPVRTLPAPEETPAES